MNHEFWSILSILAIFLAPEAVEGARSGTLQKFALELKLRTYCQSFSQFGRRGAKLGSKQALKGYVEIRLEIAKVGLDIGPNIR